LNAQPVVAVLARSSRSAAAQQQVESKGGVTGGAAATDAVAVTGGLAMELLTGGLVRALSRTAATMWNCLQQEVRTASEEHPLNAKLRSARQQAKSEGSPFV